MDNLVNAEIGATLLSGFVGAILVQFLSMLWDEWKRYREKRAILVGVIAECDYSLSVVDEITEGVCNYNGSFKRFNVEYLRFARESSVKYSFGKDFVRTLSRAIVDLSLFNLEADYVFSGVQNRYIFNGLVGESSILVEQVPNGLDILNTVQAARQGVTDTLQALKAAANDLLNGDCE